MPYLRDVLAALAGDPMLGFVALAALKGSALLAVAGLATLLLRRGSAAVRHLVWTCGVVASLLVPVLQLVAPAALPVLPWPRVAEVASLDAPTTLGREASGARTPDVGELSTAAPRSMPSRGAPDAVPDAAPDAAPDVAPSVLPHGSSESAPPWSDAEPSDAGATIVSSRSTSGAAQGTDARDVAATPSVPASPASVAVVLLWAWALVAAALAIPIVVGRLRVRAIARRARPAGAVWHSAIGVTLRESGVRRRVRFLEVDGDVMPMTWGIARPVVLLPADAVQWTDAQRRDVLRHELAHVRRGDCLTQLVAQVHCAVRWFDPLAWVASRRLRDERERACDDYVLRAGARASEYAEHLLRVAARMHPATGTALAALAMARRSQLSDRLLAVLDDRRSHAQLTPRRAVPVAASAALAAVLLGATGAAPRVGHAASSEAVPRDAVSRDAASPDAAGVPGGIVADPTPVLGVISRPDGEAGAANADSARPTAPVLGEATAPLAAGIALPMATTAQDGCSSRDADITNHTSMTGSRDGVKTMSVRLSSARCSIEMDARGEIGFAADLSDITSLSPGGRFELSVRDGGDLRRVEIRNENGTLTRTWSVNGERRAYDDEARAWLATNLARLEKRTAMAVDVRVPALLSRGGPEAVLDETTRMEADYARQVYYAALLRRGTLSSDQLRRLVADAGRTIDSDYSLAQTLIAASKQSGFDEQAYGAFADATRTLNSDYERRRALGALLERPSLEPDVVRRILESAVEIRSDYELATLLVSLSKTYAIDDRTRPFYVRALGTLDSDYEHRRVLDAVMASGGLSSAVTGSLLESASRLGSDYELAQFLVAVVGKGSVDASNRAAWFTAYGSLDSDYEKKRSLSALVSKGSLDKALVRDVLRAARSIRSDHECSTVLQQLAAAYAFDDEELRAEYQRTAETIDGEYEYGRVMAALRRGSRS